MNCELVRTVTSDGLRLDGALHLPADAAAKPPQLDAVLCLHGVGSNFYGSTLLERFVEPLVERGIAVLRVNTRGHDAISTAATTGGPTRQGAAYEVVDQCRYDVAAWTDFLVQRGWPNVALLGHSLGAIKAIYAAAYEPHPATRCIVALSPPCLSFSRFEAGEDADRFAASVAEARRLIDAGQPEQLFQARFPFPLLITAAGYLEKYGPQERYNLLRFAHLLRRPVLFTYGELELRQGVAFRGLPDELQQLPARRPLEVRTIDGADHFYTGVADRLVPVVVQWLLKQAGETPHFPPN